MCTAATASEEQDSRGSSPAGGDEQGKVLPLSMEVVEMSHDFTPETDRCRLQYVALLQPKLLRGFFGRLEWQKRLRKRDVDKRVMCRDAHMQGWMFRTVTEEDLSLAPMITGEGTYCLGALQHAKKTTVGVHRTSIPRQEWTFTRCRTPLSKLYSS